ncbi:UDP-N-acetylmuramoyl-tripeptide--D-alanyl-D-alanine ligase [Rickettsiales endosymbiont of Stachyamoeba lipophora]|uniref:UDP-N-acetylmuramoyl-tripeptide--D-alanyl-D- alanine ligase n=1 Tax=Rickettsiales endosymbiont of Stachyamoeba lipophora TaxID=2486578 RepID=UPI000F64B88A|nr:UDP-N-acetylmuramoyl-tripeptide--D-alanyl-D-alanine ligase [Rickettsiales endosymbiont of Stachyamoeba lipophora]AZL15312.1 UDP-N-acetylmuramoyl-tripeptide--D-alanyl-D-alanine ligase [Rickettsiales endosymbiont of Stachyamoeba lipophora]
MSEIIWDDKLLSQALGQYVPFTFEAYSFEFNSKEVQEGSLFIALRGENGDGHSYIKNAQEKGAICIIAEYIPKDALHTDNILIVKDSKKALNQLGKFKREHVKATYIGVTGSVGKTSTKEMIYSALSVFGMTHKNAGNFNNELGLPITLARMPNHTQYAVLEMGMNHLGELKYLTSIGKPDIAVITTVEAVHLEFFNSIETIAQAKAEIFEGLNPQGLAIINHDNAYFELMNMQAIKLGIKNIGTFGAHQGAYAKLIEYKAYKEHALIKAQINDQTIEYQLGMVGRHQAINSLIPLFIINHLGLDLNKGIKALSTQTAAYGRGTVIDVIYNNKHLTIIDESYNASPVAVKAALYNLAERFPNSQKIAILGDMKELGTAEKTFHQELKEYIIDNKIAKIICIGSLMRSLFDSLPRDFTKYAFSSVTEYLNSSPDLFDSQDVILVKGSFSMGLGRVVSYLKDSK